MCLAASALLVGHAKGLSIGVECRSCPWPQPHPTNISRTCVSHVLFKVPWACDQTSLVGAVLSTPAETVQGPSFLAFQGAAEPKGVGAGCTPSHWSGYHMAVLSSWEGLVRRPVPLQPGRLGHGYLSAGVQDRWLGAGGRNSPGSPSRERLSGRQLDGLRQDERLLPRAVPWQRHGQLLDNKSSQERAGVGDRHINTHLKRKTPRLAHSKHQRLL